ncbi:MAG: hypothetical protein LBU60_05955, partial [Clostridiales bacterium]|nr:hypothetical protein [Clostridiales bacterium]
EVRNQLTVEARIGTIIGHSTSSFNTNNIDNGSWSHQGYTWSNGFLGIGAYNNGKYLFANFDRRVGRQG